MNFAILHKIVLLTVALCAEPVEDKQGFFVSNECNARVVKVSNLLCDINTDDFETCYSKIKTIIKGE